MPSSTAVVSANWNWVRFPMVTYSNDAAAGSRSAMIYSVNVGDWLTEACAVGERVAGELFIGTADGNGDHSSDGHAFASRPSSLEFSYKYFPEGGETFYFKVELLDASGRQICSYETASGPASDSWKPFKVPFTYQDITRKAASIRMSFKSTSASKPAVKGNKTITVRGNVAEKGNFGSILYIDNIVLEY